MKRLANLGLVFLFVLCSHCTAAPKVQVPPPVAQGKDGKLQYVPEQNGDRVPDFSYAGYRQGAEAIPNVPVRVVVKPVEGDNTEIIQRAIDYVSSLPENERGVVLLDKGRFEIAGGLTIKSSGVVLRGSGAGKDGTLLVATGTDRRALITISGDPDKLGGGPADIMDDYVPVGATKITLQNAQPLHKGEAIRVVRVSSADWIKQISMDELGGGLGIGWKPGSRDIAWERNIVSVDGNTITLDAPLTCSIDKKLGGGKVFLNDRSSRVRNVGVENLSCDTTFDATNAKDEAHSWFGVIAQNAEDIWIRQVNFSHFAGGAVQLLDTVKQATVEDCKSLFPTSEIGGWRRHAFFTQGQLTLFQRCWSEDARHDFAVGFCAAGPNAFVQCESARSLEDSGPIDSWATGVLFDNVRIDGNRIAFGDRGHKNQFAGWAAANCLMWNCMASVAECDAPPGANQWSLGTWAQFDGDGDWFSSNEFIKPVSLYYAQLSERLGKSVRDNLMQRSTSESSSPTPEEAAALKEASQKPAPTLSAWIDAASKRTSIPTDASEAKLATDLPAKQERKHAPKALTIQNGWLVIDGNLAVGDRQDITWWTGSPRAFDLSKLNPNPVRYVPGRVGWGLTDDLQAIIDSMTSKHRIALEHHYGLWYDRRRDDHERIRRMDGDVWPPFYEQPFARSGQGSAWDGLSKYDLTKYNAWYWDRLKKFADQCDANGLILVQQHYFQHNILEAGAHWVDCPWRSANNINDTGFPEPPPFAGDKRIFQADLFYDETNPVRRKIHEAFIRKSLDNFNGNHNVIHLTSEEFTGPQHFVEFWLDTISQWKSEKGHVAIVGLSATKDVQDAILADAKRAAEVDLIDIRYWWYQDNGKPYAPPGGANLAPRQHLRVLKPRPSSFEQVYRATSEYRTKFLGKPVLYSADTNDQQAWAVLMGGGSLPPFKFNLPDDLAKAIPQMTPTSIAGAYALAQPGKQYLVYVQGGNPVSIDLSAVQGTLHATWYSTRDASVTQEITNVESGKSVSLTPPGNGDAVVWVRKKN